MSENERLRKVVHWLISQGFATSHEDVATQLGHDKTYLSQILIGKKPVSTKFVKNACEVFPKLNPDYILMGTGEISIDDENGHQERSVLPIDRESEERKIRIAMLEKRVEELEKEKKSLTEIAAVLKYQLEEEKKLQKPTNVNS